MDGNPGTRPGYRLATTEVGQSVVVERVEETAELETVYNLRVASWHTYFVGAADWGFQVWVHNKCTVEQVKKAAGDKNITNEQAADVAKAINEGKLSLADVEQHLAEQVAPNNVRTGRGDQSKFAAEAEEIVAEATGVPRNPQGPGQQSIPGSGPGGVRIPDLKVRGPDGSLRLRGTVVEVKASTGTKFGDLSQRARDQIRDAVDYVKAVRQKSSLVKEPATKELLQNAKVEVFSDLPAPTRGEFKNLIDQGLLEWKPIPR